MFTNGVAIEIHVHEWSCDRNSCSRMELRKKFMFTNGVAIEIKTKDKLFFSVIFENSTLYEKALNLKVRERIDGNISHCSALSYQRNGVEYSYSFVL